MEITQCQAYVPSSLVRSFWFGTRHKIQPDTTDNAPQQEQHRILSSQGTLSSIFQNSTLKLRDSKHHHHHRHQPQTFALGDTARAFSVSDNAHFPSWLRSPGSVRHSTLVEAPCGEGHQTTVDNSMTSSSFGASVSLTLVGEIPIPNPAYVRVIKQRGSLREKLLVTSFSVLPGRGSVSSVDVETGAVTAATSLNNGTGTRTTLVWPNEVEEVPSELDSNDEQPLIVSDGFLVPGKDRGGIFVVKNHGKWNEETIPLTDTARSSETWFYHRAVWVDLKGEGRKSILTARCRTKVDWKTGLAAEGELVWLECPEPPLYDHTTGNPLEEDGSPFDPFHSRHTPWKEHVLGRGPDVMFAVADMNPKDNTIEVISSQFFGKQVVIQSIERGSSPRVIFERVIDADCSHAFSTVLANIDDSNSGSDHKPRIIHDGSTVDIRSDNGADQVFTHILISSHACRYDWEARTGGDSGSVFAYRVPKGTEAWKTVPWQRETIASNFLVKNRLSSLINPGAPGFVYPFRMKSSTMHVSGRIRGSPLIAVAGDCSQSAYIYRPVHTRNQSPTSKNGYEMMLEIECGATVGSIGIGSQSFLYPAGLTRSAGELTILYIPLYEESRVLVFCLQETHKPEVAAG